MLAQKMAQRQRFEILHTYMQSIAARPAHHAPHHNFVLGDALQASTRASWLDLYVVAARLVCLDGCSRGRARMGRRLAYDLRSQSWPIQHEVLQGLKRGT
jgi:hypothetical protein